jgi:hypothetical protein
MRILADRKTSPFSSISFFRFCPFVTKLRFFSVATQSFFVFEDASGELFSAFFLLVPDIFFFVWVSYVGWNVLNGLDKGGTPAARIQGLGGL